MTRLAQNINKHRDTLIEDDSRWVVVAVHPLPDRIAVETYGLLSGTERIFEFERDQQVEVFH